MLLEFSSFQNKLWAETAPVTPLKGEFSINKQPGVNSSVGDWFRVTASDVGFTENPVAGINKATTGIKKNTNLIYLFRVGNEKKSGILIGAK